MVPLPLDKPDLLHQPPSAVCLSEPTCAGDGREGDGKKAGAVPPENPVLAGLSRAYFLQTEQVHSYRAQLNKERDNLEND
jgi:hypothetical protein